MRHRFALLATALLALCAAPASADLLTVGVYDENVINPNTVDFTASGSSFTAADFGTAVHSAFLNNEGGVLDASLLSGDPWSFGAAHSKAIAVYKPNNWAIAGGYGISETGCFASVDSTNVVTFVLGSVTGGTENEHVTQFGMTVLSRTDGHYSEPRGVDLGLVTVTALISGGGRIVASRLIPEPTGLGDTFFGFAAPSGHWITRVYTATEKHPNAMGGLFFDDVGFITSDSSTPEPATGLSVLLAALLLAAYRLRN